MGEFDTPATGEATEAAAFEFLDTLSYVRIDGDATDGQRAVVEMRLREGHAPPMHIHREATETIHVLDGELDVHTPDSVTSLDAGASAVLPNGEPHSLHAVTQATILAATSPAGFEEFIEAVGKPAATETVPTTPPSEDAVGRVSELAPAHDIEIVGPPPVEPPE